MYAYYQVLAQHSILKAALGPWQNRKKCVTFLREGGGEGFPGERPYDVSRGQNQFVTLP